MTRDGDKLCVSSHTFIATDKLMTKSSSSNHELTIRRDFSLKYDNQLFFVNGKC